MWSDANAKAEKDHNPIHFRTKFPTDDGEEWHKLAMNCAEHFKTHLKDAAGKYQQQVSEMTAGAVVVTDEIVEAEAQKRKRRKAAVPAGMPSATSVGQTA